MIFALIPKAYISLFKELDHLAELTLLKHSGEKEQTIKIDKGLQEIARNAKEAEVSCDK